MKLKKTRQDGHVKWMPTRNQIVDHDERRRVLEEKVAAIVVLVVFALLLRPRSVEGIDDPGILVRRPRYACPQRLERLPL